MTDNIKRRKLSGQVISDKMDKTIVVLVSRTRKHSKYHKQYRVSRKYKVHDPKNEYKKGDKVVFKEAKPLSKEKRRQVVAKAKSTE